MTLRPLLVQIVSTALVVATPARRCSASPCRGVARVQSGQTSEAQTDIQQLLRDYRARQGLDKRAVEERGKLLKRIAGLEAVAAEQRAAALATALDDTSYRVRRIALDGVCSLPAAAIASVDVKLLDAASRVTSETHALHDRMRAAGLLIDRSLDSGDLVAVFNLVAREQSRARELQREVLPEFRAYRTGLIQCLRASSQPTAMRGLRALLQEPILLDLDLPAVRGLLAVGTHSAVELSTGLFTTQQADYLRLRSAVKSIERARPGDPPRGGDAKHWVKTFENKRLKARRHADARLKLCADWGRNLQAVMEDFVESRPELSAAPGAQSPNLEQAWRRWLKNNRATLMRSDRER